MNLSCPACGTRRDDAKAECPTCAKPVATDHTDSMLHEIVERNRKAAKQDQDKASMAGVAVAVVAYELVIRFVLDTHPTGGFDLARMGGAAVCGAIGGAIGNWVGRPKKKPAAR